MKPKTLLPFSQKPAICHYSESRESSQRSSIYA
jgi:hypothetical protein